MLEIKNDVSKSRGVVYTPFNISDYMIKNTISENEVINNPYLKILDPACGNGNILIPVFNYLKNIFENNIDIINRRNGINISKNEVAAHIINNNLYGFDTDESAIRSLHNKLQLFPGNISPNHIVQMDFLLSKEKSSYDFIIANPPYIGHKLIENKYFKELKCLYSNVFKNKSDISYCFIFKSILDTVLEGRISIITSRYFMESCSGKDIRKQILKNCSIEKIVDFYGIRPFKNIGIDPAILFLRKSKCKNNDIQVVKSNSKFRSEKKGSLNLDLYDKFIVKQSELNENAWILKKTEEMKILRKIEKQCIYSLGDVCRCYQGIITGCDKAFILDSNTAEKNKIEKKLLRRWIKNSCIDKNKIIFKDKYIIYSDDIDNMENYPCSINYIKKYKNKLLNRRECRKGIREWYKLQWGRNKELFEGRKIVFPYKSEKSKFAIDCGSYFSADIYALKINEDYNISYEYLSMILNSKVYDFYFKSFAKKLGRNLYEYYPSTLLKLGLFDFNKVKIGSEEELYEVFHLTEAERKIIESDYEK